MEVGEWMKRKFRKNNMANYKFEEVGIVQLQTYKLLLEKIGETLFYHLVLSAASKLSDYVGHFLS